MKYILIIFLSVLFSNVNAKDISAITSDGKSVVLHENGKWVFEKVVKSTIGSDFRKSSWGMSKSQVKEIETEIGEAIRDDDEILAFSGKVSGVDTLIAYIFVNDKLVRAKYVFIEGHSNKNDYLNDYNGIQTILNKKYGKAIEDATYWKNDLYKSDYQSWGMALSIGHLTKYSNWNTPTSKVWLSLTGDNYKIEHSAEYSSIRLADLEKAKSEDKHSAEF